MSNSIDYEELLRKYINHVGCEEGVDFISRILPDEEYWGEVITTEELEILKSLRY